jgi:hypothetical protein
MFDKGYEFLVIQKVQHSGAGVDVGKREFVFFCLVVFGRRFVTGVFVFGVWLAFPFALGCVVGWL